MRKIVATRLSAEQMTEDQQVLVVNRNNVPLAFVTMASGWWKYDVEPVGTHRKQPCDSIKEVKEWITLNRGMN